VAFDHELFVIFSVNNFSELIKGGYGQDQST